MDIKMINEQIKYLQYTLSKNNLSDIERESLYDTLTFLLDSRALIVMRGVNEQTQEEKN